MLQGGWRAVLRGWCKMPKTAWAMGAPSEQLPIAILSSIILVALFRLQRPDRRPGAEMRRGLGLKRKENAGQAPEGESKR